MGIKDEDIILIEAFLKGQLNDKDLELFNHRLSVDNAFADSVEEVKALKIAAKKIVLHDKLNLLKDLETSVNTPSQETTVKEIKPSNKKWYLLAASLLGLIITAYFLFPKQEKDLGKYAAWFGDDFSEKFILHETLRAATPSDSLTKEQRRAYELYSIQEFDMASPLLKKLWEEKRDSLALFYWGVSEIGRGNVEVGEGILGRSGVKVER